MASKDALKRKLEAARKARNVGDRAVKELTDLKAPKGAQKAKQNFKAALVRVAKRAAKRIPILKERIKEKREGGAQDAVRWAYSQNGVTETPANSNWGHPVEDWIRYTGYTSPVPWCGCFVAVAVCKVGGADIPTRIRLGYGGYIIDDARSNSNGLTGVPLASCRAGDVGSLWGGQHIVLVAGPPEDGFIPTVEGNTSATSAGSQSNGGCVAVKKRAISDFTAIGRPAY